MLLPRKARIWYPGANYHIMCRGNHRHDIYRDDEDRQVYLTLLRETKKEHNFHLCSGKVSHPVNFSRGQTPKQLGNYSDNCAPCCIRDEGRPLGTAMQVEVSNHLKLLWTKAMVVSVKEKARQDLVRYARVGKVLLSPSSGVDFPFQSTWYFPQFVE